MPRNERLRQYRIQRNWRQQELADHLETSLVTIQRWERGSHYPSAYHRIKLCTLFGVSAEELGFVGEFSSESGESSSEGAAQNVEPASKLPTREIILWTVPYSRNLHFIGRNEQLNLLEQRLLPLETAIPINQAALTQAHAITGLGGIGKTQIAVEYAYRARARGLYTHTLWITAASEEAILTSFAALAEQLPPSAALEATDQQQLAAAVLAWLEQCAQPWLLIFDNADDLALLPPYLPRRGHGRVLLTTRASAVGSVAAPIEVDPLEVREGIELVLRRAQRVAHASAEDLDAAGTLVAALGQFPLALDQAGAYLEETGCSVQDYLQLYQQQRHRLLARRGSQVTGYPDSVATTWSLSFEQLAQTTPAAADLLRLCAHLSPDHIPEELLRTCAPYWPPTLREAVSDPLRFNELLEALRRFSLVKRLANEHMLSLHRLVQAVQKERQDPDEQRAWAERLIRAVHAVFPADPTNPVATWSLCQRYLEQAYACDTLIQEFQISLPEAADLLNRTASYLRECALYTLAGPLYQRALRICEQQFGPDHLSTAETLYHLAILFWRQGKYAQAAPLLKRVLRIREQHLGPEHPQTAVTLNDLAILSYEQGKYAQAEPLFQQALRIREQHLGLEHVGTAETLHNLASIYYQLGRYEESEMLFQRALRIREQQLGPEHPEVTSSLSNLANLYRNQGKYAQAEPLYQRALHIREQQLGSEHPDVVWPLYGLANLYYLQGRYQEAEPLFLRALHIWEQRLGPAHPDVAYPLHGLALLYYKQGQEIEAESFFQRALHIREQQLGAQHPGLAVILHDFARFLQAHNKTNEATIMYQRALTIREHALGIDHPLTNETRNAWQE